MGWRTSTPFAASITSLDAQQWRSVRRVLCGSLFQARCLSGRGKSKTRGFWEESLCCADTKDRGPSQKLLRRAKWPRFSVLALQSRAQPERVASSRLNTKDPLCSSRRHPDGNWPIPHLRMNSRRSHYRSLAARYGLPPRTPEEMGAWGHRSKPISPEAN